MAHKISSGNLTMAKKVTRGKSDIIPGEKSLIEHIGESLDRILELSYVLTQDKTDEEVMMAAGVRNTTLYLSKGANDIERRITAFNENVEKLLTYTSRLGGTISFHDGRKLQKILISHELIESPDDIMTRKDHERKFSPTTFDIDTDIISTKMIAYIHAIMKRTDAHI